MGKWKKWLSAGLFTAMLGTVIIAGPTADVSANAGNKPYNIENVSPDAHLAPSVGDSSSKTSKHGYGLKIMGEIAEKYNGILSVQVHNGLFSVTTTLCLDEKNEE